MTIVRDGPRWAMSGLGQDTPTAAQTLPTPGEAMGRRVAVDEVGGAAMENRAVLESNYNPTTARFVFSSGASELEVTA